MGECNTAESAVHWGRSGDEAVLGSDKHALGDRNGRKL